MSVPSIIIDWVRRARVVVGGSCGGVKFLAKNGKKWCFFDIFFFHNLNFSRRRGERYENFYPLR